MKKQGLIDNWYNWEKWENEDKNNTKWYVYKAFYIDRYTQYKSIYFTNTNLIYLISYYLYLK